jgi:hypothetical protein
MAISPGRRVFRPLTRCHRPWPGSRAPTNPLSAKTIEGFSVRLRDQVDLDTLSAELLAVVDQTVEPTTATLWLRPAGDAASLGSGQVGR